jgi:hypothetical protein
MTENELRLQMRIYALEVLAVNLLSISCLASGLDPRSVLAQVKQQMLEGARRQTFPDLADPAMSDLASAELETAVEILMEMAKQQIDVVPKAREKKLGGHS